MGANFSPAKAECQNIHKALLPGGGLSGVGKESGLWQALVDSQHDASFAARHSMTILMLQSMFESQAIQMHY